MDDSDVDLVTVNIWKSWAIYVSIALIIIMALGVMWGYRRDKKDELVLDRIRADKNKIYVGVYLDPIITVQKDIKFDKQESEKLVTTSK